MRATPTLLAMAHSWCSPRAPVPSSPTRRPSSRSRWRRTEPPIAVADPQPVELPRDDGPHDRLTEWWYYTGHLRDDDGGRFGFEFVIFRAERGAFPVSWASHLALTDETADAFHYDQRSEIGPQVDRSPSTTRRAAGFDLAIVGADHERPETCTQPPWTMAGADGTDRLAATLVGRRGESSRPRRRPDPRARPRRDEAARAPRHGRLDRLRAGRRLVLLLAHRMTASGSLDDRRARRVAVKGNAWFDHQWGDFIAVGGGGWDWFAVNLDDGTDLTLSLVRDADGSYPLVYGTLVEPTGGARHLPPRCVRGGGHGRMDEPADRRDVPGRLADRASRARSSRSSSNRRVADQELDTRATTGVIYWEGSQDVRATRGGATLGGEGYVELTGYAGVLAGR